MQSNYLSRTEAAEYLGISLRMLDGLVSEGEIPRLKIGARTRISRLDLERYLERRHRVATRELNEARKARAAGAAS